MVTTLWAVAFSVAVLYAVLGNVAVYVVLLRRGVSVKFMWAGTPGYLYRICHNAKRAVGTGLERFALSTNVALALAVLFALGLMASAP